MTSPKPEEKPIFVYKSISEGTVTVEKPVEELGWRVGRKLGRTLYRNGEFMGILDSPKWALDVTTVMNNFETEITPARVGAQMHEAVMAAHARLSRYRGALEAIAKMPEPDVSGPADTMQDLARKALEEA